MRLVAVGAVNTCTLPSVSKHLDTFPATPTTTAAATTTSPTKWSALSSPQLFMKRFLLEYSVSARHHFNNIHCGLSTTHLPQPPAAKIGKKWMEYQGINNWAGLLDPLNDNLRSEILRYGHFVEAAYRCFDFDPSSPTYASCKFSRNSLLNKSGCGDSGYTTTKNLRATSGLQLPQWIDRAPSWLTGRSSWIGYVAVCQDREEINRLGRRDVVIAYRGTATCMEWFENLRASLACLPNHPRHHRVDDTATSGTDGCSSSSSSSSSSSGGVAPPMVESGFLSLYTSRGVTCPSLQEMVREEVARILDMYGDEPLSFTITGHSLGAALATLTAYDIKSSSSFAAAISPSKCKPQPVPMVTVISFGGPRVGNGSFRSQLERSGARILRIVNTDDLITKVPGFVIEEGDEDDNDDVASRSHAAKVSAPTTGAGTVSGWELSSWVQRRVAETQWAYAEVGQELRLSSKESPLLNKKRDVATCHELSTYLHLVGDFKSSDCPFRSATGASRRQKLQGLTARS